MFDIQTEKFVPYQEKPWPKPDSRHKGRCYTCPSCKAELFGADMDERNIRKNPKANDTLTDRHCKKCGAYVGTVESFSLGGV
jgi:ribosomal protein S14